MFSVEAFERTIGKFVSIRDCMQPEFNRQAFLIHGLKEPAACFPRFLPYSCHSWSPDLNPRALADGVFQFLARCVEEAFPSVF